LCAGALVFVLLSFNPFESERGHLLAANLQLEGRSGGYKSFTLCGLGARDFGRNLLTRRGVQIHFAAVNVPGHLK
jgi:hypothetical protein